MKSQIMQLIAPKIALFYGFCNTASEGREALGGPEISLRQAHNEDGFTIDIQ